MFCFSIADLLFQLQTRSIILFVESYPNGVTEYLCFDLKNSKKHMKTTYNGEIGVRSDWGIHTPKFKILESGDIAQINKTGCCLFCGKELTGKRSKSKFCSDECRYRYHNRKKKNVRI